MIQKFIVTVESSDEIYASDLKNELDIAYKHGNAIFEVEETIETTEPSSGTEYKTANTCEWIKYDYRTMCPREHGDVNNPYWRIPVDMKHLLYCPYCGMRIRLTEE